MSVVSGRPNTRVSTATSAAAASSSAVAAASTTPTMLYGRFPRRFTLRSTPRSSPYIEWEKYELLPPSYRPYTGRRTAAPDVSHVSSRLQRLNRPTLASQAKRNFPWTKDAKVVCKYSWNNSGLATYRDTVKCVYDVNGGVKMTTQRGSYTRM